MAYNEQFLKEELEKKRRTMDTVVNIALIGQPGAGKSSLINALVGKRLFETGVHTDTTVEAQPYQLDKLIITDLPGYGTARFPFNKWMEKFHPEKLDLYLFVFDGKLHEADLDLFKFFEKWKSERKHPYFIVRNKEDQLWDDFKSLEELKKDIQRDISSKMGKPNLKIYFTSCKTKDGIKDLKKDILSENIPNILRSRLIAEFRATSKEDLDQKRNICLDDIDWYAWAGAANGVNPIPGVDAAVDAGIILKMFSRIRNVFGLDSIDRISLAKYEMLLPIGKKVFDYATQEGVLILLKSVVKKSTARRFAKYIPLLGQAISATASYKAIAILGESYTNDCYTLAEAILSTTLNNEQ